MLEWKKGEERLRLCWIRVGGLWRKVFDPFEEDGRTKAA